MFILRQTFALLQSCCRLARSSHSPLLLPPSPPCSLPIPSLPPLLAHTQHLCSASSRQIRRIGKLSSLFVFLFHPIKASAAKISKTPQREYNYQKKSINSKITICVLSSGGKPPPPPPSLTSTKEIFLQSCFDDCMSTTMIAYYELCE